MITIGLSGGLGNQMFQYALGRELASMRKTSLRLDISGYKTGGGITWRQFLLSDFNIKAEVTEKEISETFFDRAQNKVDALLPYYLRKVVSEVGFGFDKNILSVRNNSYLNGYWQSEKYFTNSASSIRDDFTLKKSFHGSKLELLEFIKTSNAVSVHFRRGDYLKNEEVSRVHGLCDFNYYTRAIDRLRKEFDNMVLVVFSDDQDWVKSNFKIDQPIHFVESNYEAAEEIYLMSLCKHNIIANSTFSWWGAWLNQYREKIVIAPEKWFATDERSAKDILPAAWIKM